MISPKGGTTVKGVELDMITKQKVNQRKTRKRLVVEILFFVCFLFLERKQKNKTK